jgi:uncharacterized protein (DUF58 family)
MKTEETRTPEMLTPELMARVSQIQVRTHRLVNDVLSGAYRSSFRGSGVEFDEVRLYQPGDDVRSIDWLRTAKTGDAFVKTYVEERELTLMFLVDTSLSMDFGSRDWTKREVAAAFCALLAFVAQRHQDRVGLCLFGATTGVHLPPRKGAGAVARVVREVIAAPPTHGGTNLGEALELQARTLRRRSLLFVISDFLGLDQDAADLMSRLGLRHDVVAVRVVDPLERELPKAGSLWLSDLETGARKDFDTRSARVRDAWRAAWQERDTAMREKLVRAHVDLIELGTGRDLNTNLADPLVRFFHKRRRRKGASA